MFSRKMQQQIALFLSLFLILPLLGPLPEKVLAAPEDNSVFLEANSGSGNALLVTGLIIGGIILWARSAGEKKRAQHYQVGVELMAAGQYDAAITEFQQAKKYKDAPVYLEKAKAASCDYHYTAAQESLAQNNHLSAYRHLKRVIELNPNYRAVPDLYARVKAWLKPFLTVKVAVIDFDNSSGYNLGRQASGLLVDQIVNSGLDFVEVVERVQLQKILQEQRLWGSGYFDTRDLQEIGKLLGVNYLILGEIHNAQANTNTTYTVVTDNDKTRFRYRAEREAHLSAGFRVVNVRTGAVTVSDTASRTARDTDYSYWRWGFNNLDSESKLMQQALEAVIRQFGNKTIIFLEKEVSQGLEGQATTAL
mgnify:CR=1 FL=1